MINGNVIQNSTGTAGGDLSPKASGNAFAIKVPDGTSIFVNSTTASISALGSANVNSFGIRAVGDLEITGNAGMSSLTVKSGPVSAGQESSAIKCTGGDLTISNVSLNVENGDTTGNSYGVYTKDSMITTIENSTVNVKSGNSASSNSIAIYAEENLLKIKNSTVKAIAGDAKKSIGMYVKGGYLDIEKSAVSAEAGKGTSSYAINVDGDTGMFSFEESQIDANAKGGEGAINTIAINTEFGILSLGDDKDDRSAVNARAGLGNNSIAIYSTEAVFYNVDFNLSAASNSNAAAGMRIESEDTIEDAVISLEGCGGKIEVSGSASEAAGLYTEGTNPEIKIEDCDIDIDLSECEGHEVHGINATQDGDVTIKNSFKSDNVSASVNTASGQSRACGIYGKDVTITTAGNLDINANGYEVYGIYAENFATINTANIKINGEPQYGTSAGVLAGNKLTIKDTAVTSSLGLGIFAGADEATTWINIVSGEPINENAELIVEGSIVSCDGFIASTGKINVKPGSVINADSLVSHNTMTIGDSEHTAYLKNTGIYKDISTTTAIYEASGDMPLDPYVGDYNITMLEAYPDSDSHLSISFDSFGNRVFFDMNGKSDTEIDMCFVPSGDSVEKPADPSANGCYVFEGWYDNKECTGEAWDFANDKVTDKEMTLYAKWRNYNVTFDLQGKGTNISAAASGDGKVATPGTPTCATQKFVGWFKESLCENEWNFANDTASDNAVIYAKWRNFNVTFDVQGKGTNSEASADDAALITKPDDPTTVGYKFVGWYKEAACTNAWNFASDNASDDTTLYAKWRKCKVTFNMQGMGADISATASTDGSIARPTNPTYSGYTFVDWYKETSCTNTWDFNNFKVSDDITLYAKWIKNPSGGGGGGFTPEEDSYKVTFNVNGHGIAPATQTVKKGEKAVEPKDPTTAGYLFEGWYTDAAGYYRYNFNDVVNSNITLYAKWTLDADPGDFLIGIPTTSKGEIGSPTLKFKDKTLEASKDFTFTIDEKNNKVKIKGLGEYASFSKTVTIKAVPKKMSHATSQIKGKGSVKFIWKIQNNVDGYQIKIATDSKFKNGLRAYSSKSGKTFARTFKSLQTGKNYYVKVRAFDKIAIDDQPEIRIYGKWSDITKTAKIK